MSQMRILKVIVPLVLVFGTLACNKNKFNTKPSLTLKSINGNFVPVGGMLTVDLDWTDKEGDISNIIMIAKQRTNQVKVPTIRDTLLLPVPEFPEKSQGSIQLRLDYQLHLISALNPPSSGGNPPDLHDDTLILKFALRDRADNTSDTLVSEAIIVQR
jgi:hypothetical protein